MSQIVIDTAMNSDLPAMAEIDGEWDAGTIGDFLPAKNRRTYVARSRQRLVGYMVIEPDGGWLVILRLRSPSSVTAAHLLLEKADGARGQMNHYRMLDDRPALAGILLDVPEDRLRALALLKRAGFRVHRGRYVPPTCGTKWITMVKDLL